MEPLLFVSADGHAAALPETFRPYLEPQFRALLGEVEKENEIFLRAADAIATFPPDVLDLIDKDNAIRSGGIDGSWSVERRLTEMDREGVAAEILIYATQQSVMPFFGNDNNPYPPEVRFAGVQAYHRWVAERMAESNGRLFAVADPGPCLDIHQSVAEIRWAAENGFRSVSVPGIVADPDLPALYTSYYEPLWRACADLNMVLSIHAGHGRAQGQFIGFLDRISRGKSQREMLESIVKGIEGSPFELNHIPARTMWQLMLGGVFDRYPHLQLALTEVRADWVPATLRLLDERHQRGGSPLARRPSDYWRTNCWAAVSSIKKSEVQLRHEIGVDRMMFGRDYPHPEGTWPNTNEWLRDALGQLPESELRHVLGENAVRCYQLDESHLRTIAARIGPLPSDILGNHPVDAAMIAHFDARGGYAKSAAHIDAMTVASLFEADVQDLRSRV